MATWRWRTGSTGSGKKGKEALAWLGFAGAQLGRRKEMRTKEENRNGPKRKKKKARAELRSWASGNEKKEEEQVSSAGRKGK